MSDNDKKYGASVEFAIFKNDHKEGKQPDRRGRIEMTKALLQEMVDAAKDGQQPILQLACWDNTAKNTGNPYIYGRMSMDKYAMDRIRAEGGSQEEDKQNEADAFKRDGEEDEDVF